MTILLLVRLGAAVIAILMCSWAMAIAWAAGTQGDADGLVTGATSPIEMPIKCMIHFDRGTGAEGAGASSPKGYSAAPRGVTQACGVLGADL